MSAIRPGEIWGSRWGSTMTLWSFYEVLSVSKSGKSIRVRELETKTEGAEDRGGNIRVVPIPRQYRGAPMTRRLRVAEWQPEPELFFSPGNSRHTATRWDGEAKRENHYD